MYGFVQEKHEKYYAADCICCFILRMSTADRKCGGRIFLEMEYGMDARLFGIYEAGPVFQKIQSS